MVLTGCYSPEREARQVERTLRNITEQAEQAGTQLANGIENGISEDSIWILTHQSDQYLFYIFNRDRLVYWSDNRIAANDVLLLQYNKWWYKRMENAHIVGRWTRAGGLNILTVIPVKYAYQTVNQQLRNTYIAPFKGKETDEISRVKKEGASAVSDREGNYLFSISSGTRDSENNTEMTDAGNESTLNRSFAYRILVSQPTEHPLYCRHDRIRLWLVILVCMLIILLISGIAVTIRSGGIANLKLRAKIMYLFTALQILFFAYVFTMSMVYVRNNYEERQMALLSEKCHYVQSSLQALYYWDIELSEANTPGLNIDLRDLCFTYQADIHVYNLNGRVIGSSAPELFTRGLVSKQMASEPMFTHEKTMVQYEQIGTIRYLAAYTPFYNGAMVPVGYISVASYISQDELHRESDQYLARLMPPCILLLLLSILVSYAIARALTHPLSNITENLRKFRLGDSHRHIDYKGHDEVGELVLRYNEMVDQLEESSSMLARSERETAWRTMARQIAHEINNPLTPMRLRVQQLQRLQQEGDERFDQYFKETAKMLVEQIDDLSRIATSFSTFAKMPEVHASQVDVAQKLSSVVYLMRSNPENIPVRYVGADNGVMAMADSEQISEVFTNIIKNALQALAGQEDGDVIVVLSEQADEVVVKISDNGPGIDKSVQDKIFLPNFTTKSTGAGLGLAICKNIVEGADGRILVESSEKGTDFFVYFKKKQ